MESNIAQAIRAIADEKNIPYEQVLQTVEAALAAAYRKDFGEKDQNIFVNFDPETGAMKVKDVKTVVEDVELPAEEVLEQMRKEAAEKMAAAMASAALQGTGTEGAASVEAAPVDPVLAWNPRTMMMLSQAQEKKPDAQINDIIETELPVPGEFGRMAAMTAKQVIMQKLREAERGMIFNEYKDKEKDVIVVTVTRREGRVILVDLGRATGVMLPEDQIERERYAPGERLKVYLKEVGVTPRGPELLVSRTHAGLVQRMFATEIPEIASGVVEIKAIAREGGSRTKLAVMSHDENIDPIGSCIGQRGARIQTIIGELGGEKIDVIQWSEDPKEFIMHAMAPARVAHVELKDEDKTATVFVPQDQLSLAIGKGGQNVRLAAKLTGWKMSVQGEGEAAPAETPAAETPAAESPEASA